jgi:hypothetical protein
MEIVVVDDFGEGDLAQRLGLASVRVVRSRGRGSAAVARNTGARHFAGEVLVFVDSDVLVEPEAVERLVAPILQGTAEATVGNYAEHVVNLGFATTYKQVYIATIYSRRRGYLKNEFWTALGAVRRSVFVGLGGFATSFPGACGEDTEFGFRLTTADKRILPVNDARGMHLKKLGLWGVVRNDLKKGSTSAGLFLERGLPLRHFRHSSPRDIVAVATATALLCLWPLAEGLGLSRLARAGLLAGVAAIYLVARGDLVRVFLRRSAGFLLASLPVMFLLDLVRAVCVARAALRLVGHRIAGAFHPGAPLHARPRGHHSARA